MLPGSRSLTRQALQMAKGKDKNYVSFWFWMLAIFVMALPCVGTIMILVWAFTGENESRKNFFRATIAWFLILTGIWTAIIATGFLPVIAKHAEAWIEQVNADHKQGTPK